MVIGIIIIFYSITLNNDNKKADNSLDVDFNNLDLFVKKKDDLVSTIEEADDAILQLNALSKNIFEKQEEKYQELLYLYEIIDEKKHTLLDSHENRGHEIRNNNSGDTSKLIQIETLQNNKKKVLTKSIKNEEIINLNEQGMSIIQIAKHLNIGQGEVSLVLELKRKGGYSDK